MLKKQQKAAVGGISKELVYSRVTVGFWHEWKCQ